MRYGTVGVVDMRLPLWRARRCAGAVSVFVYMIRTAKVSQIPRKFKPLVTSLPKIPGRRSNVSVADSD